jgi:hypothetical protein
MPAKILPFDHPTSSHGLPLDEFTEVDNAHVMLTFALERASHPDFPGASHAQMAALANHALSVQKRFQAIARRVLTFAGHPPEPEEFQIGDPAAQRLQRAALFGDPIGKDDA